jgi:hypothetical protein
MAIECAKNLKNSFSKVGAFSSEQKFIRGNPDEVIQWINGEVEAFEEILSDRGLLCLCRHLWGYVHFGEGWL